MMKLISVFLSNSFPLLEISTEVCLGTFSPGQQVRG